MYATGIWLKSGTSTMVLSHKVPRLVQDDIENLIIGHFQHCSHLIR